MLLLYLGIYSPVVVVAVVVARITAVALEACRRDMALDSRPRTAQARRVLTATNGSELTAVAAVVALMTLVMVATATVVSPAATTSSSATIVVATATASAMP